MTRAHVVITGIGAITAFSNSFGLGGQNACPALKRYKE
jgi:hypothetical protein